MSEVASTTHFRVERVAPGVYAAIGRSQFLGNAGIVDLGDRTLVFDAFRLPQAASELRAIAERLFGRPVSILINSHWHGDHILGSQAFGPETALYASEATAALMESRSAKQLAGLQANAPRLVEAFRSQQRELATSKDARSLAADLLMGDGILETLSTLRLRQPSHRFANSTSFEGTHRTARLVCYTGHTESDAVLYLDDGIALVADLVVVRIHPAMSDGDPERWLASLDEIAATGVRTLVPGHGPVTTATALREMQSYLKMVNALVEGSHARGRTKEQIAELEPAQPFDEWEGRDRNVPERDTFRNNLLFLAERKSSLIQR